MTERAKDHPGSGGNAKDLADYWAHGKGAAQIRWPQPGAFERCVRLVGEHAHMSPGDAKGYCAERHHQALGYWPGQKSKSGGKGRDMDGDCGDVAHDVRAADLSAWNGSAALSHCSDSGTPASCYRSICAGRKSGDPEMQSSWALPHHSSPGAPANVAAVRNALARLSQTQGLTNAEEARAHLDAHLNASKPRSSPPEGEERSVPFEMASNGDGLTMSGYAAVFGVPTTIRDMLGDYTETIKRGAFTRSLGERTPVLMFDHGRHPLIGPMPLGVITRASEDDRGLYVEARLSDNWLIGPVRDAVRDGAVTGMSFRFTLPEGGGDNWNRDETERELIDINVRELGPVVFPAYEPTTVAVRSALEALPSDIAGRPTRGAGGSEGTDKQDAATGKASRRPSPLDVHFAHSLRNAQRRWAREGDNSD